MIPQDTVNQILASADIVEVVGEFVNLKKRGANMIACCPFHNEKTPSFSVSPSKGIYKCFGCGKGGDAVRFLMDLEGLSYPESLRWLAKKYGIEIVEKIYTDEEQAAQNEKESLFIVTEFAQKHFYENLTLTEEGKSVGYSYFLERGFSQPMIEKFNLGYALNGYENLYRAALDAGFSQKVLDAAGLISVREDGNVLDRFRGRVIFPIHNLAGKPIAFGGRILKTDAKAPKYVNSPETSIYHKSHILYGIAQAKNAIRQKDFCFLVEGYIDVVSLHQVGIENVVASSGTALTPEQIRLIGRFTRNVVVLYDGDEAGIRASLRGIDLILEEGLNVKSVVFPDGDDPDSFVRKVGGDAFIKYINENEKDFIRFRTELSLKEVGDDTVKKAGLISELVETITKVPDPVKRRLFYRDVAELLKIDEDILISEGNLRLATKIRSDNKTSISKVSPAPPILNQELEYLEKTQNRDEENLIKDLILYGAVEIGNTDDGVATLADFIFGDVDIESIQSSVLKKIYLEYYSFYNKNETPPEKYFVSHKDTEIQDMVIDWLSPKHYLSDGWEKYEVFIPDYLDKLGEIISKVIYRIYLFKIKKEIRDLVEKLDTEDEAEQEVLMNAIEEKNNYKQAIAGMLGSII